jgi:hypothetical protein
MVSSAQPFRLASRQVHSLPARLLAQQLTHPFGEYVIRVIKSRAWCERIEVEGSAAGASLRFRARIVRHLTSLSKL